MRTCSPKAVMIFVLTVAWFRRKFPCAVVQVKNSSVDVYIYIHVRSNVYMYIFCAVFLCTLLLSKELCIRLVKLMNNNYYT